MYTMAIKRELIAIVAIAFVLELVVAENYTVGGPNGAWDTSTDLQTWSKSQTFLVGDNLIFQYSQSHDVVEVTKSDYDKCQATNQIRSYSGGNTVIPLSTPGKRYFICGTIGHCLLGMQLELDTLASATPSISAPPIISPSPMESPVSSPTLKKPGISFSPANSPETTSTTTTPSLSPPTSQDSFPPPAHVSSSAIRDGFRICLAMGFCFLLVFLLAI